MIRFVLYRSRRPAGRQRWRWRAVAGNGRIIAVGGEAYNNAADAAHAIGLLHTADAASSIELPADVRQETVEAVRAALRGVDHP